MIASTTWVSYFEADHQMEVVYCDLGKKRKMLSGYFFLIFFKHYFMQMNLSFIFCPSISYIFQIYILQSSTFSLLLYHFTVRWYKIKIDISCFTLFLSLSKTAVTLIAIELAIKENYKP